MKYKRISKRAKAGAHPIVLHIECEAKCEPIFKRCEYCDLEKALLNRLCELEDRIEDGTLVELPCKIGDKLYGYRGSSVEEIEVTHFVLEHGKVKIYGSYDEWRYLYICDADAVGREVFYSREEAQKELVDGGDVNGRCQVDQGLD